MNHKTIKFSRDNRVDFIRVVRKRVSDYFETNGISKYGNIHMVIKTITMLLMYVVPYVVMMSGILTNSWAILGMWIIMGVAMAGIGFSIMHDANHGAYSKNQNVNKYLGYLINIVGGSAINWKIQHNVLHHTFTNVDGMDEDIDPGKLMRLSPHRKRYKLHRIQHIYGWGLYGLMTFLWITTKDFRQLYRYKKMGLTKAQNIKVPTQLTKLIIAKVVYYIVFLVLPIIFLSIAWWQVVLFFIAMHFTAGLILGCVFQPAHVMPSSKYPLPDKEGNLENDWAVHQLYTTTNFSPKSRILGWYVGGLNYQIEHHLFPTICHVHYKKISRIVKETAEEFGLPYHSQPNFFAAIMLHARMLRDLGKYDVI
ncbi:acyl-CoA desaturase [Fulvivirga ulvae]|uniref:fatty acid desaturase family protein n=1 Tax=Fulvivirga ulvae TaxID=2904245 RepID=UPI001F2861BA|nr:acyl-CoA desaturase [Fulvivirga ulvae]UII31791.1 acyl-CoA desaturase [Fulvivirga ulvae]